MLSLAAPAPAAPLLLEFVVLYRPTKEDWLATPEGFLCSADDPDHAEEQCINAYPDADVLGVYEGHDFDQALHDYFAAA